MFWTDCCGTPIVAGAKVAYNFSGDVVPGEVVEVLRHVVKIRLDDRAKYSRQNHISTVRRPRSILVLELP